MDTEIVFSIEESEEGGYVAEAPEYSVQTEADNLNELVREIHYTILRDFEEQDRPTLISMRFPRKRKKKR